MMTIKNFHDFCDELLKCGFSMGGGNDGGVFALIPYSWENQSSIDSPIKWHTGDPETDPWEWRMRVLRERDDIAYAKVFLGTSGYITKEWYPLFLSVRRRGEIFEDAYESGTVSRLEKRLYDALEAGGALPLHELKRVCGILKDEKSAFERAMTALQTRMFITMSGAVQKTNALGIGYGWNVTVFTTVERFWEERGVALPAVPPQEAYEKIAARVQELNPKAAGRKIERFICG